MGNSVMHAARDRAGACAKRFLNNAQSHAQDDPLDFLGAISRKSNEL